MTLLLRCPLLLLFGVTAAAQRSGSVAFYGLPCSGKERPFTGDSALLLATTSPVKTDDDDVITPATADQTDGGVSSLAMELPVPAGAPGTAAGMTYYVDSRTGDDAFAGCTPSTAWRSLLRLRQQKLQPGDSALFARGGQWRGFLVGQGGNSTHGPVTYGAFGQMSLPKPALLGSVSPRSVDWSHVSSGIWAVNISALATHVVAGAGIAGNEVTDVGNLVLATNNSRAGERKLGRKVWNSGEMKLAFDFHFDRQTKTLLLKSPGE